MPDDHPFLRHECHPLIPFVASWFGDIKFPEYPPNLLFSQVRGFRNSEGRNDHRIASLIYISLLHTHTHTSSCRLWLLVAYIKRVSKVTMYRHLVRAAGNGLRSSQLASIAPRTFNATALRAMATVQMRDDNPSFVLHGIENVKYEEVSLLSLLAVHPHQLSCLPPPPTILRNIIARIMDFCRSKRTLIVLVLHV